MPVSELTYARLEPKARAPIADRATRLRAGTVSVFAAIVIFVVKFVAYQLTGSTAILSDALESVVNIVAATFTLVSLAIASMPADESHPYGHGKVEFLASGFEGGAIAFAALVIVYQAVQAILFGREVADLDAGLALVVAAGLANLALGYFLLATGRRTSSPAIVADGHHVLSDFWTSAGVVVGLVLVRISGWQILDPLVAAAVGANLAIVGGRLLRRAVGGLLDESDPALLKKLTDVVQTVRTPAIIAIHRMRSFRSGGVAHVDAHVVVPRFWSVSQAHDLSDEFEIEVTRGIEQDAECIFHLDPCRAAYCSNCRVEPCPVRAHAFIEDRDWSLATLTGEAPQD
jgi:cation diffusion facilitator family transporter